MTEYPALIANSCVAYPDKIAYRNAEAALTFGELSKQSDALRAKWSTKNPKRVILCADRSVDSFIALHTLNRMGVTVICLRASALAQQERLIESSGADHKMQTKDMSLEPCGPPSKQVKNSATSWSWSSIQFELLSSGTTGAPTWHGLTTRQLVLSAFASAIRLGHQPNDQWLNVLAPGHMGWLATIARCALYGTTLECHAFDVQAVADAMNSKRIAQVSLVPSMLSMLMDKAPASLKQVRTILVGGGPTPPTLLNQCHQLGLSVHTSWGMTEAASQLATRTADDFSGGAHVGPAMPFAQVSTEKGKLVVDGPLLNQRLETNDLGSIDAKGRITVLGRADDVILTSGHKVYPRSVEVNFSDIEGIAYPCIVGLPDPAWGEIVALVIQVKATTVTMPVLNETVRIIRSIQSPQKPRRLLFMETLPTNETGKISRHLLRRVLRQFDELMGLESLQNGNGQGNGLEGVQVDGSMCHQDGGPQTPVGVDNVVPKSQSALTDANYATFDDQFFALTQRDFEVTFGVNEGQSNRMLVKELIPVAEDRKEELFESNVRIFEDATEKNDARAVNLVESRFEVVTKSHDVNLLWRKD